MARGAGYTVFLSPGSATFRLQHHSSTGLRNRVTEAAVVRMDLVGADPRLSMESQEKLPGVTNYLTGNTPPNCLLTCPATPPFVLIMSIRGSTWFTTAGKANSNMTSCSLRGQTHPGYA